MAEVKINVARPGSQGRGKLTTLALLIAMALMTGAGGIVAQRGQASATLSRTTIQPPRLVVFLVVDQMRADYITMYEHQWTKGLRRLLDTGAIFPLAAYPYSVTLTCPGHSTISTGSFPSTHGMVANEWYDREAKKSVPCTEDATVTDVGFGGRAATDHHSLARLKALTFADELRAQSPTSPTIVTISLKPRSSITLAGRPSPSTYPIWEENNGTWATSGAYTSASWPVVDQYVAAHPMSTDYGQIWTRTLPAAAYLWSDAGLREPALAEFPHTLGSKSGTADAEFSTLWKRSPLSDRFIGGLGQHLVRELKLGQHAGTDVLGLSFSALDVVGHEYGPRSHEVQDILIRLDETIGEVLTTLDRLVGRDRYVLAFSSDHGVAPIPEQSAAGGISAGRYTAAAVRGAINTAIAGLFGEGTYVATSNWPNVYVLPGVLTRILATPGAREVVTQAALSVKGLARVYWADELASTQSTTDPFLRAARLSYKADRAGDLMVLSDPYWIGQANGTTHGTAYDYDQRVPVLFAGAGIKPGRYLVPATPADIAPTLVYLTGITMAHTDGVIRTEAIK